MAHELRKIYAYDLVKGYIRNAQLSNIIIPKAVIRICYNYYHQHNVLIYIEDFHLYISDLDNAKKETVDMPSAVTANDDCSGLYFQRLCNIPYSICKESDLCKDILFQVGAECRAITLDIAMNERKDYTLPNPLMNLYANSVVYSQNYGLISCGGQGVKSLYTDGTEKVFNLPMSQLQAQNIGFDVNDDWHFEWNEAMKPMIEKRYYPSSVLINCENKNAEKLIVLGGFNTLYLDSVEIYDFVDRKWQYLASLNHARYRCGVCYDSFSNLMYIGGGFDGKNILKSIECYDIVKNKWMANIAHTQSEHDDFVNIWKRDNLLFISSLEADIVECIDLRQSHRKKAWTTVSDSLTDVFGIETATNYAQQCVALVNYS